MTESSDRNGYSIASVSRLTGVGCHTLRVWERRYGFPVPTRTPKGQRRYSTEVVDEIRRVSGLVRSGRSISAALAELRTAPPLASEAEEKIPPRLLPPEAWVDRLLDAVKIGDEPAAVALLDRAQAAMSAAELVGRVLEPAMVEVGERWFRGELQVFHERFASTMLLRRLDQLIDGAKRANVRPGPRVLVCTVQGDRHEGGVRILTLALELHGRRALPLGVDIPTSELAAAVAAWRPEAVAVSFVLSRNINKRFDELAAIDTVPVFLGGRSLTNHQKLARDHGLIPLSGGVFELAARWDVEIERWRRSRGESRGG